MSKKAQVNIILIVVTIIILTLPLLPADSKTVSNDNKVQVAQLEGIIDPVSASYFQRSIKRAEQESAILVVLLDTPGGLDDSMRQIVKATLASKIPVVIYVSPSGARAASAGCFITIASHVAAMAPGTNIGAAHPIAMGGAPQDKIAAEKATSDAVAYIKGLARLRDRNEKWAEDSVRKSSSITAEEALKINVIDYVEKDLDSLLKRIDGKTVLTKAGKFTIETSTPQVEEFPMSWVERLLHALSNPNIAYLLLMIGFYGIIYEFSNPGVGFAGIGGAICLILAFYSLHILPVNYAGVALILLGLILFVAEAFTPTFGVLAGGGLISFIIGSLLLFETPLPALRVSIALIIPIALTTLGFILIAVGATLRAHRKAITTGKEGMIGLRGVAKTDLNPNGQVFVRGELWKALSEEGKIEKNENIEVVSSEGLTLHVRRVRDNAND